MKTKSTLATWFILFHISSYAQITFQKSFDFYSDDQLGYAVKQTFDGGYILTGFSDPNNALVIKTDAYGDTLWTRSFRDEGMCGFDVIQTADSNFVISGYQYPTSPNAFLLKIDGYGNSIWYTKPCLGWGQALQETFDRDFIIAGKNLTKTDSLGEVLWCIDLDFQAMYIIQSADSNYVTSGFGSGQTIYLQKTDTSGTTLWTKFYDGKYSNTSNNILTQTTDGGYILAGTTDFRELLLIKTDANGDTLWTKRSPDMIARSVDQTRDGGYVIGGTDYSTTPCALMILKTDVFGNTIWIQRFFNNAPCTFSESNHGKSIRQTQDGGFIFTGVTANSMVGYYDFDLALIKTDSLGNILATATQEPKIHNNITVYPNPFHNSTTLQLNTPANDAAIFIYNQFGQVAKSINHISTQQIEIHRDGLTSGIYFISITNNNKVISTQKLIITD